MSRKSNWQPVWSDPTRLQLVRPHDLEVHAGPLDFATAGRLRRVTRVGFEVRLEVDTDGGQRVLVTPPRTQFQALDVEIDAQLWLRPAAGAPLH